MIDLADTGAETGSVQPPLTALIDMVFMLLIYFLLTMGFMTDEGIGIKLPEAKEAVQPLPRDLVVAVTEDGAYLWEGNKITLFELEEALKAAPDLTPETRLVIRADRGAKVNSVVRVMDLAKAVGAASFCLATETEP